MDRFKDRKIYMLKSLYKNNNCFVNRLWFTKRFKDELKNKRVIMEMLMNRNSIYKITERINFLNKYNNQIGL